MGVAGWVGEAALRQRPLDSLAAVTAIGEHGEAIEAEADADPTYGQRAELSLSSGTTRPTARATASAVRPVRHQASSVRSLARWVRRVASVASFIGGLSARIAAALAAVRRQSGSGCSR
jgi:hypothetical protein